MKESINPWTHIWVQPRKTLRGILTTNPKRVIIWLAIISGIVGAFLGVSSLSTQEGTMGAYRSFGVLAVLLIGGALLGLFHLYFGGWLLRLTGSWMGGKGSFTDVKCAVGWSNYPVIIANLALVIAALLYQVPVLAMIFGLLNILASVWAFILLLFLVAEAHRFSAWRALWAFLLGLVLVFAAMVIIGLLVPLLGPLWG